MRRRGMILFWMALGAVSTVGCGGTEDSAANGTGGSGGTGASGGSGASAGQAGSAGSAGSAGAAGGMAASCPEGFELGDYSGKPVIEVRLGQHGPYQFVYDTGAPTSLIDDGTLAEVGAGPYQVQVGDKQVELPWIMNAKMEQYGLPDIAGIIGKDVMGSFAVTLDRSRMRWWLEESRDDAALSACAHVAGDPVDVAYEEDAYFFVPGSAEKLAGWFLVDTGASLGAMPDAVFDQLDAAHPRPALSGFYTPAGIGTFWARLTAVGELEVAGRRVRHIVTRTFDDGMIPAPALDGKPFLGVLPNDYLSHFLMTVDHPKKVIRLDRYADDVDETEPSKFFVVGIALEETTTLPIHVAAVLPGSSAQDAGVMVGDEVISIRGTPVGSLSAYQRPWALVDPQPKAKVSIVISRNGTEQSLALEARDLLTDPALP